LQAVGLFPAWLCIPGRMGRNIPILRRLLGQLAFQPPNPPAGGLAFSSKQYFGQTKQSPPGMRILEKWHPKPAGCSLAVGHLLASPLAALCGGLRLFPI